MLLEEFFITQTKTSTWIIKKGPVKYVIFTEGWHVYPFHCSVSLSHRDNLERNQTAFFLSLLEVLTKALERELPFS